MSKRAFGELESEILHILNSSDRMTVKEVHQKLGGKDNYNTVMTVMSRLAEKMTLGREKMGMHYEYWVLKETSTPSLLEKLKKRFIGVKTSVLVSHFIETSDDLTEEDLKVMEALIQQKRALKK